MTIHNLHNCCSHEDAFFLSDKRKEEILNIDVNKLTDDVIEQLYKKGKITKQQHDDLFKSMYHPLKEAVNEGFGKIEYGTPNYQFLKQLQTNTAIFSIFKSYAYVKDMVALLKDETGNVRPKEEFKREALKVDNTYNKVHLDTQYDQAVRTGRMAQIWQKAIATKDLYPNLEYTASRAAHPRIDHEAYYGIILPIDDPFWITHFPPNGWRCQCGAQPTDKAAEDAPHNLPPVDDGFDFNPGMTGQIFNIENSDYIQSVPEKEQPALIKEATKYVSGDFLINADNDFTDVAYKSKSGGKVEVNQLAYDNGDFKDAYKAAQQLANRGEKVKILPELSDEKIRKKFLPEETKKGKNPDYLINDNYLADLKIVTEPTIRAVQGAISRCHEQCNNIVLKIDDDNTISSADLQRAVKGKLTHDAYDDFENLWIYFHEHWKQFTRAEILKGEWF